MSAQYKRYDIVEGIGQFSQRGGLLDYFTPGASNPVRIEFFGDEIDTVYSFDTSSQLRGERIASSVLLPVTEKMEDEMSCALDFIDGKTIIILSEQLRIGERIGNYLWQLGQDIERLLEEKEITPQLADFTYDEVRFWNKIGQYDCIMLDQFIPEQYPLRPHSIANVSAKQLPNFRTSLETAVSDITHYIWLRRVGWVRRRRRHGRHPARAGRVGDRGHRHPLAQAGR